jgi:hypothetical protein
MHLLQKLALLILGLGIFLNLSSCSEYLAELDLSENSPSINQPQVKSTKHNTKSKIENKPQGLNISRGVDYSGAFKDKRSSFGISGGKPNRRRATIQKGRRPEKILNYNVVGGNGRFYQNGKYKDICKDLGDYACYQETSRSMAAITSKGYVIWLVNNSYGEHTLYPDQFDDVLRGIAKNYCLGTLREGMLFDGGWSTGLYFDNRIYVENRNPIGSVFLIYKTTPSKF